jgi:DNA-binding transcriptional MerR regulator
VTSAGRPQRDGLSIGAVLAQLRPEFPDVTISKIRFLESEGLLRPARTPSGYRQFTQVDVDRLRYVLAAQRDHYLPLKVIKQQLDAASDPDQPARALVGVDRLPTPEDFAAGHEVRMTREELFAETGIDQRLLTELENYGLVRSGAAGFYDQDAMLVARIVVAMGEFGIEPRHLRTFKVSADREVGLLHQIVGPMYRHRDPDARERADEIVRELASLSVALHTLLVKTGLRGVAGG